MKVEDLAKLIYLILIIILVIFFLKSKPNEWAIIVLVTVLIIPISPRLYLKIYKFLELGKRRDEDG